MIPDADAAYLFGRFSYYWLRARSLQEATKHALEYQCPAWLLRHVETGWMRERDAEGAVLP